MGILEKFGKKKGGAKAEPKKKEKKAEAASSEAKAEEKKPSTRGPLAKEDAGSAYRILIRPVFTEKSSRLESQGKYVFIVSRDANKVEVARAVRDLYGVKAASVRILNAKGKSVRFGRTQGKEQDLKKAIVTLKAGETLTVIEA